MSREWNADMSAAPTNTAILINVPGQDYYGNGGTYTGMLVDMGTGKRWMTFGWAIGRDLGPDCQPTCWQSMPPPPALTDEASDHG